MSEKIQLNKIIKKIILENKLLKKINIKLNKIKTYIEKIVIVTRE